MENASRHFFKATDRTWRACAAAVTGAVLVSVAHKSEFHLCYSARSESRLCWVRDHAHVATTRPPHRPLANPVLPLSRTSQFRCPLLSPTKLLTNQWWRAFSLPRWVFSWTARFGLLRINSILAPTSSSQDMQHYKYTTGVRNCPQLREESYVLACRPVTTLAYASFV